MGRTTEPVMAEMPERRPVTTVVPMKARGVVSQPEDRHRARPASQPFLLEHDILCVKNVDEVTWEFRWDRRRYPVKPGETGYVPFPAVTMAMGDPRSMENAVVKYRTEDGAKGIVMTRHDEFCKLFVRYGIANENLEELVDFAPKLEVTTMEGVPVTFPVQNPEMVAYPVPNAPEPGKENSDQRRVLDQLRADSISKQAEIDELRELIESKLGGMPRERQEEAPADELALSLMGGAQVDSGPPTTLV